MNIVVYKTGGYAWSINGKSESLNNTMESIARALQINLSNGKELWCLAYKYALWNLKRNENRLHGDVQYLLWIFTRPHHKYTRICFSVYIINATRKKFDNISNISYFTGYSSKTGVILYQKQDKQLYIHRSHYEWFYEYNYHLSYDDKHIPRYLKLQKYSESFIMYKPTHINLVPCELGLYEITFEYSTTV